MVKESIMEYPYTDEEGRTWLNEYEWVDAEDAGWYEEDYV